VQSVLLLTSRQSVHANALLDVLEAAGERALRVNLDDFARVGRVCVRQEAAGGRGCLTMLDSGRSVTLDEIKSVFYHQPAPIGVHPDLVGREAAMIARREAQEAIFSLYGLMEGFWINDYFATRRARLKPVQHEAARRAGLRHPETLITNDPDEAISFAESHGAVVVKVLGPPSYAIDGWPFLQFTERLTSHQVREQAHLVARCPTMLQAYVEKRFEVRATVVGDRVFAARIGSQEVEEARVDWRRADEEVQLERYVLPPDIESRLVDVNRKLGMFYGAMDLIVTPDGEHVFLETNPGGAWLWLEQELEFPISAELGRALATPPPTSRS
jgi:glutathione synthase/RimK-type ligase-like ATP-grasp enzyme